MKVVVVGAGLGGLSAAAHLVGQGHDVTIVERSAAPGGRAAVVAEGGYRLDTGPTVLTMPGLLADTFAAAGADMTDFVTVRPVDPMYRAVYADGSELRVWHDRERMKDEIATFAGAADAAGFDRFCDWLDRLYHLEMANFIDPNYDSVLDLARPLAPGLRLVRMGGFRRLARVVGSYFHDERLQRIFSFQAMYAGLAPYEALALYAVITYMDAVEGVFVPDGGMHRMASGLAAAVEKAGVEIRYRSPVTRILRGPGGAVRASSWRRGGGRRRGERQAADVVVCNADLPVAYRTLLGGVDAPRAARRGRYSPSCVLWVAGVKGRPPTGAAHHNIHFGTEWDEAFEALIERGTRMPDPSILVTQHSLDDPSLAPYGCSTLYVLEPAPNLDGRVDWGRERERMRTDLVGRVATLGYPTDVDVEQVLDPLDWEALGHGARHAVRLGPHVPPDGSVPAHQRRPAGARPGLRRFVHGAGRRACRWCWCPAGWPPSGPNSFAAEADEGPVASRRRSPPRPERDDGPAPGTVTLDESYELCRQLNKRYGTTYYWSTLVLPRVKRHHVHALYGFCRYADDIVDEPRPRRRSTAARTRPSPTSATASSSTSTRAAATTRCSRRSSTPCGPSRSTRTASGASSGRWRWTSPSPYETYDDLAVYMDGSAAVIGEMMLPILEPPTPTPPCRHARDLGDAFQLTNFLRDVGEDLDRGRVYLPQEDLRRFGADPALRRVTPEWVTLMRFEISRCSGSTSRPTSASRCCPLGRRRASGRPGCSTAASSTGSRPRTTTCSPGGPGCRPGRRRPWSRTLLSPVP